MDPLGADGLFKAQLELTTNDAVTPVKIVNLSALVGDAIPNAGSVFVGRWTPEAAGDYATGANHVLPTGGLARAYGPLDVETFGSWRQVQTLTESGLRRLASTITTIAEREGLTAHAYSVTSRLESP